MLWFILGFLLGYLVGIAMLAYLALTKSDKIYRLMGCIGAMSSKRGRR